jgi:spore coat polysaccharide biosynthesis protein SpsF (cytidylyltransferase family)
MSKIVGIVQARTNSSRLPKKVLADIEGKPLIWHIVNRLKQVQNISDVVISTTVNDADKQLCRFADSENIPYYAGSEYDILDRLYQTGKKFDSTILIKVNGDCPLIDPTIINRGLDLYLASEKAPDLVVNSLKNTYPDGTQFGIFNFKTLSKLWSQIQDRFWREFIYMYLVENTNKFQIRNVENDIDLSHLRWVVDYPEDLEFVRAVYGRLYKKNPTFLIPNILSVLEKNPDLVKINAKYAANTSRQEYEDLKKKHENLRN